MAGTKVTLRTAFSDRFEMGDVVITQEGTEVSSRAEADKVIEAARRSGVTLYEVTADDTIAPAQTRTEAKNEGSGS